jgi:hypothetical protein
MRELKLQLAQERTSNVHGFRKTPRRKGTGTEIDFAVFCGGMVTMDGQNNRGH